LNAQMVPINRDVYTMQSNCSIVHVDADFIELESIIVLLMSRLLL